MMSLSKKTNLLRHNSKGENHMTITHIVESEKWEKANELGYYEHESLSKEGFIHCSSPQQVLKIANSLYKGQENLLLLLIDERKVKPEIKWEDLYDLKELYPHIYGVLNMDSVINIYEFKPRADGTFQLPLDIKE